MVVSSAKLLSSENPSRRPSTGMARTSRTSGAADRRRPRAVLDDPAPPVGERSRGAASAAGAAPRACSGGDERSPATIATTASGEADAASGVDLRARRRRAPTATRPAAMRPRQRVRSIRCAGEAEQRRQQRERRDDGDGDDRRRRRRRGPATKPTPMRSMPSSEIDDGGAGEQRPSARRCPSRSRPTPGRVAGVELLPVAGDDEAARSRCRRRGRS